MKFFYSEDKHSLNKYTYFVKNFFYNLFSDATNAKHYTLKVAVFYTLLISPFLLILLNLGFISDDYFLIHSAITNPIQLGANYKNEFSTLYRPIVIISYYINYLITNYNAHFYYITNLALHIIASVLVFLLLVETLKFIVLIHAKRYAFWGGTFFLLSPQNITNILWIPGRSDIICGIFIFFSLISFLNYLKFKKKYFIIWSIILSILGFLTKESATVVIFYLILFLFLFKNYRNKILDTKAILIYPILTILYLIFRYLIFSKNIFGNNLNDLSFNLLIKQFLYGSFSLLIPIDILDFYYLLIEYFFVAVFLSILIFVVLVLSIKSFWENHFNVKLLIVSSLLAVFSLSIYVLSSFPQMRLMYLHLPFLILAFSIIIFNLTSKLKKLIILSIILLSMIGNILIIQSVVKIDDYTKSLISAIKSENIKGNSSYFLIPTLSRVGQRWSVPYIQNLANYAITGSMDSVRNNFFESVYLETYSIEKIFGSIKYVNQDSSSFHIAVNDRLSGLVYSPSKKNLGSEVVIKDSLIKFTFRGDQTLRKGFSKICEVQLLQETNNKNVYIIFFYKNKLLIKNVSSFLSFINN